MTMDTLQSDMDGVSGAVRMLGAGTTTADLVKLIKDELWPVIQNVVAEIAEVDGIVEDLVDNAEDILQPETAKVFAAVIAGGAVIVNALKARSSREVDPQLWKVIAEFEANIKAASETLEEIVIPSDEEEVDPNEEDADPDDPESDDEEDEEDDDEESDEGDAP